jgi:hypothetical protein
MFYSEYYDTTLNESEMETALEFYIDWCDKNNLFPEVVTIAEGLEPGEIDHILYHAEIEGYSI